MLKVHRGSSMAIAFQIGQFNIRIQLDTCKEHAPTNNWNKEYAGFGYELERSIEME